MNNKKILVIGPQDVLPALDGGKQSIFFPMKQLAVSNKVSYLFPVDGFSSTDEIVEKYSRYGITALPVIHSTKDSLVKLLLNIFQCQPFKMKKYYSKVLLDVIRAHQNADENEIVIVHHVHMASVAVDALIGINCKMFLYEHNLEYELVEQLSRFGSFVERLIAHWQSGKTEKFEKWHWQRNFEKIFFISKSDYRTAHTVVKDKAVFVGPATEFNYKDYSYRTDRESRILFFGSLRSRQNLFNLSRFYEKIWKFRDQTVDVSLGIIGSPKTTVLSGLPSIGTDTSVDIFGFVEDLSALIEASRYAVSPTWFGSGFRFKILEAMSKGVVVFITQMDLATSSHFVDMENVVVFDSVGDFFNKLRKLEADIDLRDRISRNASFTASEFFSSKRVVQSLSEEMSS